MRFIANKRQAGDEDEYRNKLNDDPHEQPPALSGQRSSSRSTISDASDFETSVSVTGVSSTTTASFGPPGRRYRTCSPRSCSTCATGCRIPPHAYFEWSQKGPGENALRFLIAGEGDIPPLTHEILRLAEPDDDRRPQIHVG